MKKKVKEENKQLDLGLKSPFVNFFYGIKHRFITRLKLFEANTFINDPIIWFFLTFMLVACYFQLFYLLENISQLPSLLPLFGDLENTENLLLSKFFYLLFPIFSIISSFFAFNTAKKYYFNNQTLSYYILLIFFLILLTVDSHILSILSLYV